MDWQFKMEDSMDLLHFSAGYWEAFAMVSNGHSLTSLAHAPGLLTLLAKAGQHPRIASILPKVMQPSQLLEVASLTVR